jgi:predicted  nucleic acid-binding Zn-ribbon protein
LKTLDQEIASLRNLLVLQKLDDKIGACKAREVEIPKQKTKFDIQRKRLKAELEQREQSITALQLEQKDCESTIEQRKAQILKYQQQLNDVKKNDEYQALLHEIELEKKQISAREERILNIMVELEAAAEASEEDKKRIQGETDKLDALCAEIDDELGEAVAIRNEQEKNRDPILSEVSADLIRRYNRLRRNYAKGKIVVPVNNEVCGGCHMHIRAQVAIEVMEGNKIHACQHCGRLLFHPANFEESEAATQES